MNHWIQKVRNSPALVRAVPFVLFLGMTSMQDLFSPAAQYWIYLGKTVIGIGLIWFMHAAVTEMRWTFSWEAVAVGIGVFVMWVGIDRFYPHLSKGASWKPWEQFGMNSPVAWICIIGRILGTAIIVPPLEEAFYRSFLYRFIITPNILSVPLSKFNRTAFLFTAVVFGFSHNQWLAGILCAFAYQWLVLRKNHLGDAMTAHGITNFLLGVWVVWRGDWKFW